MWLPLKRKKCLAKNNDWKKKKKKKTAQPSPPRLFGLIVFPIANANLCLAVWKAEAKRRSRWRLGSKRKVPQKP